MAGSINNVVSQGGVSQTLPDNYLQEEGMSQEQVEMELTYSSSFKAIEYQLLKLEVNGQKYNGIPDIFQTNDPKIKPLFDALRAEGVISDDMSLEDQQRIMSYLGKLSDAIEQNGSINKAVAWTGTENVSVTTFIQPQDSSVVDLASQLQAQGIITDTMTDDEKLAAITKYVNSTVRYEADMPGEGWNSAANTIASGSGDCEDMAILVANLAIACGVDENKIQVCVQSGSADNQGHVVVGLSGENGKINTFDATNLEQHSASSSDFTFTFNSRGINSGNGSVGNSWSMEDANNVNSLYTASGISQVVATVAQEIDATFALMLEKADLLDTYTKPGQLFALQQQLQNMKDMIATYTAVGKMIGDTLSEAMKSFAQSLNR